MDCSDGKISRERVRVQGFSVMVTHRFHGCMSLFDPPPSPWAMMSDRLPSLQTLRCFEAARHDT
jgi:hypothetical protein